MYKEDLANKTRIVGLFTAVPKAGHADIFEFLQHLGGMPLKTKLYKVGGWQ